jgi:two-component system cell cycle sensor histidine kinase/response regulator CckA
MTDDALKQGPESKNILVVDDNDEFRQFVKRALELADYGVWEASDGEQAMETLRKVKTLDLVVCDVMLPGDKGPEIMRRVRDVFPDTKAIFMSGYIAEDIVNQDVEKILATGGVFLQKPFPTRKLLEVVHDMLGV